MAARIGFFIISSCFLIIRELLEPSALARPVLIFDLISLTRSTFAKTAPKELDWADSAETTEAYRTLRKWLLFYCDRLTVC